MSGFSFGCSSCTSLFCLDLLQLKFQWFRNNGIFNQFWRYANRAKNIKNKPHINEDPKDALLREYQEEIKKLRGLLAGQLGPDGIKGTASRHEWRRKLLRRFVLARPWSIWSPPMAAAPRPSPEKSGHKNECFGVMRAGWRVSVENVKLASGTLSEVFKTIYLLWKRFQGL